MIVYFDTSALVKKYVKEPGSDMVVHYWNKTTMLATSSVGFAEFFATVNRKFRDNTLSLDDYDTAIHRFQDDWESVIKIEITNHLNHWIEVLTATYPLRGFDAVHLASALYFQEFETEPINFLGADRRLNETAQHEGLKVVDVS